MKLLLLALFINGIYLPQAFSYETMVRHGYANCTACHYSSRGGGLLNGYGKVISQEFSSFGTTKGPIERKLEQAIQARYARFESAGEVKRFPMQLDYLSLFKFGNMHTALTISKAPTREGEKSDLEKEIYIKKALFDYKISDKTHIEFGRDYLDIGLNLSDHTTFIRANNKRGNTDFFTLLRLNHYLENSKLSSFIYLPSFQEDVSNREAGLGVKYEHFFLPSKAVLTSSLLKGRTEDIDRTEFALTAKKGLGYFVFTGQADFTHRELLKSGTRFSQEAYYGEVLFSFYDPVEIKVLSERLFLEDPFASDSVRDGYAIKWRVSKFLSLQYDYRKVLSTKTEPYSMIQLYFNGWLL